MAYEVIVVVIRHKIMAMFKRSRREEEVTWFIFVKGTPSGNSMSRIV